MLKIDIEWSTMRSGIICAKENSVKIGIAITSAVGIATLIFAGYVFMKALPDIGRYVKISKM